MITQDDLEGLDSETLAFIDAEEKWLTKARPKQILPVDGWSLAIAKSGRGFGKTEMGANWARRECGLYPGIVLHAVAPSHADLTGTMFEGISGLLAVTPPELVLDYNKSAAIPYIRFKNGSIVKGFTAQSPERLRGPQCSRVWGDEVAAWKSGAKDTLMNIDMSTRISYKASDGRLVEPQKFYTTTPKPLDWLKELIGKASLVIEGSTMENRDNLSEEYIRDLQQYEGTTIYRQEVLGELIDIGEAAIIKRSWIRLWPKERPLPWFEFIIVAMDTAYTEKTFDRKTFEADPTACQVWGVFSHERKWNMLLLDHWKDHVGFPELVQKARHEMKGKIYGRRTETLFKPLIGSGYHAEQVKRPDLLLVEDKGSGISLRQTLVPEGVEAYAYNPGRADKLSRLHAVSHVPHGSIVDGVRRPGRVWVMESDSDAPNKKGQGGPGKPKIWAEPMLKEVCGYAGPGTTAHDDDVDTFSMAMRYFVDNYMNAGVDGILLPSSNGAESNLLWEKDDQRPGEEYYDDFESNPYG